MSSSVRLFIGNDHTVEVDEVRDVTLNEYVNDATVEATILDSDGVPIPGENWPIDLIYVTDSNGRYIGNFDDDLPLVNGKIYTIEIRVTVSGGLVGFWRQKVPAGYRGFGS